ncbi:MAG: ankyrin repeat domain-containing protein [Elusimicrobiota bacterium]|nr:ankyrin repeat domain-containing protein [Elusimicrobiota bacterium]
MPPFINAVINGDAEKAQELLAAGASINQQIALNGNTPLHLAVWNGRATMARLLLAQPGIDVQIRNDFGKTALDIAREKNNGEIINILEPRR